MITYAWERGYDAFWEEAHPLITAHWNEVGTHRDILTLNPRHDVYRKLESVNGLHILVARSDRTSDLLLSDHSSISADRNSDGPIIGYLFIIATSHPRDISARLVQDDIIYVRPEYRRFLVGFALLRRALLKARELDAKIVVFHTKARRHLKKDGEYYIRNNYLRRLGFVPTEIAHHLVLK